MNTIVRTTLNHFYEWSESIVNLFILNDTIVHKISFLLKNFLSFSKQCTSLYLLSRYSDEPWSESLSNWFWENFSWPLIGGNIVCLELTCLIGWSRSHGNIGMSLLAELTAISDVLVISGLQIVNDMNQS